MSMEQAIEKLAAAIVAHTEMLVKLHSDVAASVAGAEPPAASKPKQTRTKKEQAADATETARDTALTGEQAKNELHGQHTKETPETSYQEVAALMSKIAGKHGRQAVVSVLKKFELDKLQEAKVAQYGEILAALLAFESEQDAFGDLM